MVNNSQIKQYKIIFILFSVGAYGNGLEVAAKLVRFKSFRSITDSLWNQLFCVSFNLFIWYKGFVNSF